MKSTLESEKLILFQIAILGIQLWNSIPCIYIDAKESEKLRFFFKNFNIFAKNAFLKHYRGLGRQNIPSVFLKIDYCVIDFRICRVNSNTPS